MSLLGHCLKSAVCQELTRNSRLVGKPDKFPLVPSFSLQSEEAFLTRCLNCRIHSLSMFSKQSASGQPGADSTNDTSGQIKPNPSSGPRSLTRTLASSSVTGFSIDISSWPYLSIRLSRFSRTTTSEGGNGPNLPSSITSCLTLVPLQLGLFRHHS